MVSGADWGDAAPYYFIPGKMWIKVWEYDPLGNRLTGDSFTSLSVMVSLDDGGTELQVLGVIWAILGNIDLYFGPKRGLTGKAHRDREYARLAKEYPRNPDGWKEKYEYGKRSLVESVFGAVKVKFGGTLRSRRDNKRAVETTLKVVI